MQWGCSSEVPGNLSETFSLPFACCLQVLSGCGVYDGTEIHEASAYVNLCLLLSVRVYVCWGSLLPLVVLPFLLFTFHGGARLW